MMRQSPKPYAKERGEANPSSSPVGGVLPGRGQFVHHFVRGVPRISKSTPPFVGVKPYQPPVCPVGRSASVQTVPKRASIAAPVYLTRIG